MTPPRWRDLEPETGSLAALDHAGPRPDGDATQNAKRNWSERFAHACAVAFADAFREIDLRGRTVRPFDLASGTEPLTPLGGVTAKRIDVTVVDAMLGLEIGVSLKGLNFRDAKSGNFDKNLTGRPYELGDEMRVVYDHLPHAYMAGVFFLPLEATADKTDKAESSFAHTVRALRARTGRLDAALAGHAARCDSGFVGLYADEDGPYARRGAARFLDVRGDPPRRGRPLASATLDLGAVARHIVDRVMLREGAVWGEAEPDDG
jgi:hypothetical protein